MSTFTWLDVFSLATSLASLLLGGFAIWVSFKFYQMSTEASNEVSDAAQSIQSGVERLDKLFDSLYSDTFSMMKDTVSDMRRHMWTDPVDVGIQSATEQKLDLLREELHKEVNAILNDRLGQTDNRIDGITTRLEQLVDKAIDRTRFAEVRARNDAEAELTEQFILQILGSSPGTLTLDDLFTLLRIRTPKERQNGYDTVLRLAERGIVRVIGGFSPNARIEAIKEGQIASSKN